MCLTSGVSQGRTLLVCCHQRGARFSWMLLVVRQVGGVWILSHAVSKKIL